MKNSGVRLPERIHERERAVRLRVLDVSGMKRTHAILREANGENHVERAPSGKPVVNACVVLSEGSAVTSRPGPRQSSEKNVPDIASSINDRKHVHNVAVASIE